MWQCVNGWVALSPQPLGGTPTDNNVYPIIEKISVDISKGPRLPSSVLSCSSRSMRSLIFIWVFHDQIRNRIIAVCYVSAVDLPHICSTWCCCLTLLVLETIKTLHIPLFIAKEHQTRWALVSVPLATNALCVSTNCVCVVTEMKHLPSVWFSNGFRLFLSFPGTHSLAQ